MNVIARLSLTAACALAVLVARAYCAANNGSVAAPRGPTPGATTWESWLFDALFLPLGSVTEPDFNKKEGQLPQPYAASVEQKAVVEKVLGDWERQSKRRNFFKVQFAQWTYDPTILAPRRTESSELDEHPLRLATGNITFSPDKSGSISWVTEWKMTNPDSPVPRMTKPHDKNFISYDGTSVLCAFGSDDVHSQTVPTEFRSRFLANGLLPLFFGINATSFAKRYYVQVMPTVADRDIIGLEIRPRFRCDANKFLLCEILLSRKEMRAVAVKIVHAELKVMTTGGQRGLATAQQRDVYKFE